MDKTQEKKPKEMKQSQIPFPVVKPAASPEQKEKEKKNLNESPSQEDWEGGASRPEQVQDPVTGGARDESFGSVLRKIKRGTERSTL